MQTLDLIKYTELDTPFSSKDLEDNKVIADCVFNKAQLLMFRFNYKHFSYSASEKIDRMTNDMWENEEVLLTVYFSGDEKDKEDEELEDLLDDIGNIPTLIVDGMLSEHRPEIYKRFKKEYELIKVDEYDNSYYQNKYGFIYLIADDGLVIDYDINIESLEEIAKEIYEG